jgi:hypothetical protein
MYHRLLKLSTKSFDHQRRYLRDLKQLRYVESRACMCCHANFINCRLPHFYVNSSVVDINPEIYDALMNRRPVVALESTIITHGMPHPYNIETAIEVEKIVREQVIKFGFFPHDKLPSAMNRTPRTMACYGN